MYQQSYNIIGDIAGQYKALLALIEKMPRNGKLILLGNLIDRGPQSKEVVKHARNNDVIVLKGNHEDMMCDFVLKKPGEQHNYESGIWFGNGGISTVRSYFPDVASGLIEAQTIKNVLHDDALWMLQLPHTMKIYTPGEMVLLSHAPYKDKLKIKEMDFIWNRLDAEYIEDTFQIHGHNSGNSVRWYLRNGYRYGVNIDTSRARVLTGINFPSKEIFQQEYIA